MHEYAVFLRNLAERVYAARLPSGATLGDAGDFKQWLMQLSEKAEQAETLGQFFSQM